MKGGQGHNAGLNESLNRGSLKVAQKMKLYKCQRTTKGWQWVKREVWEDT